MIASIRARLLRQGLYKKAKQVGYLEVRTAWEQELGRPLEKYEKEAAGMVLRARWNAYMTVQERGRAADMPTAEPPVEPAALAAAAAAAAAAAVVPGTSTKTRRQKWMKAKKPSAGAGASKAAAAGPLPTPAALLPEGVFEISTSDVRKYAMGQQMHGGVVVAMRLTAGTAEAEGPARAAAEGIMNHWGSTKGCWFCGCNTGTARFPRFCVVTGCDVAPAASGGRRRPQTPQLPADPRGLWSCAVVLYYRSSLKIGE